MLRQSKRLTLTTRRPQVFPFSPSLRAANHFDGPSSVRRGLVRGLKGIGVSCALDPPVWRTSAKIGVLSGVDALEWAIAEKGSGAPKTLVAGPNIVILPSDVHASIRWDAVDCVLVPSEWVRQKYVADSPSLEGRVKVWPAGVDEAFWSPQPSGAPTEAHELLIYDKSGRPDMVAALESILRSQGLAFNVVEYGSYAPSRFRDLLRKSNAMIFLSESESQGLALFEAWACEVPTLVWDRQLWIRPDRPEQQWAGASAAPYLNEENGLAFRGESDFVERLDEFLGLLPTFRPRDFVLRDFTLRRAASRYAEFFA